MSSRSTSAASSSDQAPGERNDRARRTRKPKRVRATLLPALLASAVERDPSATAIVDENSAISYAELDVRSSRLARLLISRGAGPETVVAVAATRSIESITAVWAVVKSGAAFLPVDPSYPPERIRHMILDSGAAQGITTSARLKDLPESCSWWAVDDADAEAALEEFASEPISTIERTATLRASNPAYVIYTSGSTGTPKGVVVTHAGLAPLCTHAVRILELGPQSRTLHFTSPSFDVSVFDYLIALGSGGTMVIAPPDNYGGDELKALLKRERVTHGFSTPAALTSIDGEGLDDLKALVVGGESFGVDLVSRWAPGRSLFNGYGPTESTIFATMSAPLVVNQPVTMGSPVDGTRAYVLDSRLSVVPPGVAGELYLAGAGVARGYHARSALTSARFLADPRDPAGGRMYRTGDMVRLDGEGRLEYLGRNDFQVKIRGFRIELGEVDAVLGAHPDVDFALTMGIDAGAGSTALVSYALPVAGAVLDTTTLVEWMAQSLPAHMVPSALVPIDHVPLTGAGKVDRSALPAPEFASREYRAPSTPTEEAVAGVFGELLGREQVGVDDDFFELGGNSLIGTQVAARVGARLHRRVPARMLFDAPTVAALAALIDTRAQDRRVDLVAGERPARLPLSLAQQRMWFLNRFDPTSSAYNIPVAVRLSGVLDLSALDAAAHDVIERHESLRTIYPSDADGPHQVVLTTEEAAVRVEHAHTTESNVTSDVMSSLDAVFDVTAQVPIRISLFAVTETEHVLVVVVHHIAADGSSVGPLTRDVMLAYSARAQGNAPSWAPLEVQYADYTLWQREMLGDEKDADSAAYAQLEFWKAELAGLPDQLDLPFDRPRPAIQSLAGGEIPFDIDPELHSELQDIARLSNASLFMIVHAAWAVTVSRLSQHTDIAIGSPIAGRGEAKLDDLIGMFANTVVFRTHVPWNSRFDEFFASVRDTDLEAFGHADVPFETLVEVLDPVRSTSRHPLFQVGLSFQNLSPTELVLPDITVTGLSADAEVSKFDLHLVVTDTYGDDGAPAGMTAVLTYASSLFDRSTASVIVDRYVRVLRQIAANPRIVIGDIDLLDETERHEIVDLRNETATPIDSDATLVSLFDSCVAADPDATAVVFRGAALTYREFDARVNTLARYLVSRGIGPEASVALAFPRSVELLVAMYAVVKSGAAYVPVDPAQPTHRTEHILRTAHVAAVLTTSQAGVQADTGCDVIATDELDLTGVAADPVLDVDRIAPLRPANTAYVIFTSGSTGTPKGVSVSHGSVVNQLQWLRHEYGLGASDAAVLKTPVTFDLSVWELWSMLTVGGRTVIAEPDRHREPEYLNGLMESEHVTTLFVVPSMLAALVSATGLPSTLQRALVIGESFPPRTAADVLRGRSLRLDNLYGPTEATVSVTRHRIETAPADAVPIGLPEWNTRVFVLDDRLDPVPDGVVGELYLAGAQLARGYLGRADLTAERFVADPHGSGDRVYRTGDLARWTSAGTLDYVGRADFQVKIRGFRIELGDIESVLGAIDGIREAVVIDRDDRHLGVRLVAYVVGESTDPARLDTARIKKLLAQELPSYMIPAAFVVLESLPLTVNGKVDRAALPKPVFETTEFRAPTTPVEETVAEIVSELLGAPRVGADDDFFALGGNSLLATQLVSRLGAALDTQVPVRAVFEDPAVSALAARVEEHAGSGAGVPLQPRPRPEVVPLSLAQRRMWFLGTLNPDSTTENIPVAVRLQGELDLDALARAVDDVVARHDVLRTVYPEVDGVGSQRILGVGSVELDLEPYPTSAQSIEEEVANTVGAPFDLGNDVPLRTKVLRVRSDDHVLVLVTHHIAADGFSMAPLARDVMIAYAARVLGTEPAWNPLPVQYADYTLWQYEVLGSPDDPHSTMSIQERYWISALSGLSEQLDLPTSFPRPKVMSGRGGTVTFEIDDDLHGRIAAVARSRRSTPFMVVHAALAVLLSELAGTTDVAVGTPTAGRGDAALDDLVGMFVGTVVLRTEIDRGRTFESLVDYVARTDLSAFGNADVPFERIVEVVDPPRSQSRHPLVQVLLAFQNVEQATFELPGLSVSAVDIDGATAKMDLQFTLVEQRRADGTADGYRGTLTYARDLFDESSAATLGSRFVGVLDILTAAPDMIVGEVSLLDGDERSRIMVDWNDTEHPVDRTVTLASMLADQVNRTPKDIALVFGGNTLTYAEFGSRVARTARWLISLGVGPEERVAVSMHRSIDLVVVLHAVVAAGGAYVPVDPDQPMERTKYVLDVAQPVLVVSKIDHTAASEFSESPVTDTDRPRPLRPSNAAYVVFTSGSTGRPKGVAVSHGSVVGQLAWLRAEYGLGVGDVVLQKTPFTFDVSVWELFGALGCGARLVVAEAGGHRDVEYLASVIEAEGVTATSFVPSMLSAFVGSLGSTRVSALRHVLVAGEAFGVSIADAAARVLPGARLHNLYGPTEFTVHATAFSVGSAEFDGAGVPIGRPVWNSSVYVLNARLNPVPVGVVGELYLAGDQLARGYFGRGDLTADRFVASPFDTGERIYRTGDLVRWSEDGELHFVGRSDFQVKLRGQRIELGEIEAVLVQHGSVVAAVVEVRADRLVGYVVAAGGGGVVDVDGVRGFVGERLPSYMVPSVVVVLEELPVGASGKLDRGALPDPASRVREFRAPRSSVEVVVAEVFGEVLGVDRVGLDDDFFELGGNSLVATQVVSRVGAVLGVRVPVRVVFEVSSVEGVASAVEGVVSGGGGSRVRLAVRERPERVPLSLAQQRMWFLNRLEPGSAVDNIPLAIRLRGALDVAALESAIGDVLARHESLRTVYPEADGVGFQQILDPGEVSIVLPTRTVSEPGIVSTAVEFFAEGFDVTTQLPMRSEVLRVSETDHVLVVVVHHIAADGFSMAPLMRDLVLAYEARVSGSAPAWTPLPVQYADYTLWQRELMGSEDDPSSVAAVQLAYWTARLRDLPEQIDLPTDRPRPVVASGRGAMHTFFVDADLRVAVETLARDHRATPFMVMHTALAVLLSRLTGSQDIAVGTPVAGRGDEALDDLIGMFVGTLVLRTSVPPSAEFGALLDTVRGTDIDAFGHAELPFERLVEVLDPPRSRGRHPLVQVLLSFQNQATGTAAVPDLEASGLEISGVDFDASTAKLDLALTVADDLDDAGVARYRCDITYATDLFDATSIEVFGRRLIGVLSHATEKPSSIVGDIDVLEADETTALEGTRDYAASEHTFSETVLDAFERHVVDNPDAVAVVYAGEAWTYGEFDARVGTIARGLVASGIGREKIVAVSMRRSYDMIAVLYAVLRAGAAYVPIDPDQPEQRTRDILVDASPDLIVTSAAPGTAHSRSTIPGRSLTVHDLVSIGSTDTLPREFERPTPADLAYVVFTSGSTGRPKGVAVSHGSVVGQLAWLTAEYGLGVGDVVLQKTPFTFDVSVWELFGALGCGARLVVAEVGGHRDVEYLASVIEAEGVTATSFVPSMLSAFVGSLGSTRVSALRHVLVAGEAFGVSMADAAARVLPGARLHNLYGPTEFTVHATAHSWDGHAQGRTDVAIGRPVWNTTAFVLDARLNPVPTGVVGELHLSGRQLARGYFGRADLTADRFVALPFGFGERMYRTGDLVWCDGSGELHFVGRSDFQVKLRGQRIELGEIEAVLVQHGSVSAAVVEVRADRLVGYVVAAGGGVDVDGVRGFVGERLPSYMVPSVVVVLEELPVGASGKLDRGALPDPAARVREFRAPRSSVEVVVAEVFGEVLGVDRVGLDDDFFELGGNSLVATQVVSRVGAVLGVRVPVRVVFEVSSVEGVASAVEGVVSGGGGSRVRLAVRERPERVPLSLAQQRMWFLNRLEPESAVYNVPMVVRLSGELDCGALDHAVRDVLARHETLRTMYPAVDGVPIQHIVAAHDVALDLTPIPVPEFEVRQRIELIVGAGFDVASGVPVRGALLEVGPHEHVLVVVVHHIAGDGSSIAPLARDVMTAYAARSRGDAPTWAPLTLQYADYTLWQRELLGAVADPDSLAHEQFQFWSDAVAGVPEVLDLPLDRPRPAVQSTAGATIGFELDSAIHDGIDRLARGSGSTRFMVVHAALAALLARWSGGSDIAVGTPVAGRGERELDDVIGMFVNTLVLRTHVDPAASFRDLVDSVRTRDIAAFGHADLPFEWLVDELAPVRSTAHSPLFQVLLVFQNFARQEFELDGLTVAAVDADTGTAKYDLQFSFVERFGSSGELDGIHVSITYATALFDARTIDAVGERLTAILEAATTDPHTTISSVDLLGETELATLASWNATGHSVDSDATLVSLFDAQVARTPDAIALVDATTSLTYRDFDARVNRTARLLVGMGLGPGTCAAVAIGRSIDMVVAMYAVVKTGAAYVPLDPEQPAERIRHVLEVANPLLVLSSGPAIGALPSMAARTVDVDGLDLAPYSQDVITDSDRRLPLRPRNLAYLMFTSGSTGVPKGIELSHAATVNQLAWAQGTYPLDASDVVLHKTPVTFDVSVWELFWTLQTGARLAVAEPGGHRDPVYLSAAIERFGVTTLHFVPSMLSAFAGAEGGLGSSVRRVFAAGEALSPAVAEQFHSLNTAQLHNWYGPAEAEVVTASEILAGASAVTIGSPVWNTTAHVLDDRLQPVPIGVPGELYLGGAQLARAYRGRSMLTAERFLADPFTPGGRMYRTGDLVHWTHDGQLVYRGRSDFQIKLRGQRIEPGEIEVVLAQHPDVQAAAVVLQHDEILGDRLVAYVGSAHGVDSDALTEFASNALPSYMVPSAVVVLASLPLGPTGKLDRRALPAPVFGVTEYRAPETDAERRVAALFEDVLGVDSIGLDDDFFVLGGNSLIATQVVARAGDSFGRRVPLRALFEAPTVTGFAQRVSAAAESDDRPPLVAQSRPSRIPLSLTQQRLWILNRLYPDTGVRNIPVAVRLTGPLDVSALAAAARDLVERHEVLRTVYPEFDGNGYQDIREVDDAELDLSPRHIDEQDVVPTVEDFVTRPFDVSTEVPVRAMLARVSDTEYVIVFVVHHIAADGFSMRPLTTDLMVAYAARVAGHAPDMTPLPVQYADYALWQRAVMGSEDDPTSVVSTQLSYWREHLAGLPDRIDLPLDRPRPAVASYRGATSRVTVTPGLRRALDTAARDKNASLFMVVHAALAVLIGRLSSSTDIAVSAPTAGRGEAEVDDVIGMFVNSVVLRTRVRPSESFGSFVDRVRDTDLSAFANADVPFERVVEELDTGVSWTARSPLQVALSFQNLGWTSLELSGLQVEPVDFDARAAKYDLHFTVEESVDADGLAGLLVSITYATDLFDDSTVQGIGEHLLRILTAASVNPDAVVGDIDMLGVAERAALDAVSSAVKADDPTDTHVSAAFERQVRLTPDSVAVVAGDTTWTYREFDERVTSVAAGLRASGAGPETIVALALPRSSELVVSVFAVLRAGAAFVPLDPEQPAKRNDRVLRVARPLVTVTTERYVRSFAGSVTYEALSSLGSTHPMDVVGTPRPSTLAYVLFTSGSTGEPKGVAVSHGAVVNQIGWINRTFGLGPDDVVLFKTPSVFDVSIWELFSALSTGGRLVVAEPRGHQDPRYLERTIMEQGVTAVSFVPSMLAVFTAQARAASLVSLRHVFVAGEALSAALARRAATVLPARSVHNLYGPTEFTVHATAHELSAESAGRSGVPIGRPVTGTGAYVLDTRLGLVPNGVVGELWLAGVQLARGYHGRPDLTADRFVADPFGKRGARMYRTGDLVRRDGDGVLSFVRRSDEQVKLRGMRVEPGEIESALVQHDSIAHAVVVVLSDRLIAYVTPTADASEISPENLRDDLRSALPSYMIPFAFVVMESLPTTPNGKVDRAALPDPVYEERPYRAPEGPIEETVARVFASVLDLPRVGRDDDFFELGGNSLVAAKVVSRLGDALRVTVPLRVVFDLPTVSALANAMTSWVDDDRPVLLARPDRPELVPLSVQQQRTWTLAQWIPGSPYFNIPVAVRLHGPVDAESLESALHDVVERHESLRTVYVVVDEKPVQKVLGVEDARLDVAPIDVTEDELVQRMASVTETGIDISVEPPIRVALFRLAAEEHVIVVVFHHIAADGSSFAPFARDLGRAYVARTQGEAPDWSPLPVQYADFALWQRAMLGELTDPRSRASTQMQFWREELAGQPDLLNVPLDHPRPETRTMAGDSLSVHLDRDLHAAIDGCARAAGTTRFMVVHAAMAVLLAGCSDNDDVAIGTPTAGRGNEMLDDLVGMFVSTVVLRTKVDRSWTFGDLLADVRRRDIDAFGNTDIPFDWILGELLPPRPVSQVPFFQVLMAFQNYEQNVPEFGDVTMSFFDTSVETAKVDLHFTFVESTELDGSCAGMTVRISYATELFEESTVRTLGNGLVEVLEAVTSDADVVIGDITRTSAAGSDVARTQVR